MFMQHKDALVRIMLLASLALLGAALSGCVLATVRTLNEDVEAKQGFTGAAYVAEIWDSRVLPTYDEQAQDLPTLLALLAQDQQAAIDQFGHRSGTGPYSFMVRGEARVLDFDTSSRTGLLVLDFEPADGTADASLVVGPLIRISQRAAVRDAVGFIEYGSFVNQQEFADVANAMGERITAMIAEALGASNVEAIRDLDPTQIAGKLVRFVGAMTYDDPNNIVVVPVRLEVVES